MQTQMKEKGEFVVVVVVVVGGGDAGGDGGGGQVAQLDFRQGGRRRWFTGGGVGVGVGVAVKELR